MPKRNGRAVRPARVSAKSKTRKSSPSGVGTTAGGPSNAAKATAAAASLVDPTTMFPGRRFTNSSSAGLGSRAKWIPLQVSGGASRQKLKTFGSKTPFGRPGQPGELAGIYVQLADNQASFATGQVYGSAGGSGQP
jgi:NAD(P)-dependent dehydrogenase (short-subunit alcohol dehydrogenase family)